MQEKESGGKVYTKNKKRTKNKTISSTPPASQLSFVSLFYYAYLTYNHSRLKSSSFCLNEERHLIEVVKEIPVKIFP